MRFSEIDESNIPAVGDILEVELGDEIVETVIVGIQENGTYIVETDNDSGMTLLESAQALDEKAPPGMEDWIKHRKADFKKRYGDRWEEVLYATAWKRKNNESLEETALGDKEDLLAKRKELQRIQMDPETSKDPLLKAELARRKAELEKEAAAQKGVTEGYGRYWCSTDKKWKERQGPKQTREAANPAQQAAIAIAKKKKLKEFAPDAGDGGEEETLHKYARIWYNGDMATQQQVEKILERMGWEIGEIESEEGGAFVVRSGDENGNSYIGFAPADLTEGMAEGSDEKQSFKVSYHDPKTRQDKVVKIKARNKDEVLDYCANKGYKNVYVEQGVAEGDYDIRKDPTYQKYNPETHTMMYKDGKHKAVKHDQVAKAKALGWKVRSSLKAFAKGQGVAEGSEDLRAKLDLYNEKAFEAGHRHDDQAWRKYTKLAKQIADQLGLKYKVTGYGLEIIEQGVAEEKTRLDPKCWDGYKKQGTKMKGGVRVNNCVKEEEIAEAEYQGRQVKLGKPQQGDVKKFKVYVRNPKTGKIIKVNFGDPNMRIKKSNPKRRKSFRARHNCSNPGPRTKARYWSCRKW